MRSIFPCAPGRRSFRSAITCLTAVSATIDPQAALSAAAFRGGAAADRFGSPRRKPALYEDKQPPDQPDAIAEVASNLQPGQTLAFKISGDGHLQSQPTGRTLKAQPGPGTAGRLRPTAAPAAASARRSKLLIRWKSTAGILGGFAWCWWRERSTWRSDPSSALRDHASSQTPPVHAGALWPRPAMLLEALKEELFQLEMEHKQGQITEQEYEKPRPRWTRPWSGRLSGVAD